MKISLVAVAALLQVASSREDPNAELRGAHPIATNDGSKATAALAGETDAATTIVDLSEDFARDEAAIDTSPGGLKLKELASQYSAVRAVLVLEHGKIVGEYTQEDLDPSQRWDIWSVTKGLIILAIGKLVTDDAFPLELDTTLGEIWADSSMWDGMEDTEFRQAVTVLELITMTSGLLTDDSTIDTLNNAGDSLSEAISSPLIGEKGEYSYLIVNNILSYVIWQTTCARGDSDEFCMTPLEFFKEYIFPSLDITEIADCPLDSVTTAPGRPSPMDTPPRMLPCSSGEIAWGTNADDSISPSGIETAFHNMEMTPGAMAKFGQLYLQRGNAGGGVQVVPGSWIDDTLTHFATGSDGVINGYTNWKHNDELNEDVWFLNGARGQYITINRRLDRVLVMQSEAQSMEEWTGIDGLEQGVMWPLMEDDVSFVPVDPSPAVY